MTRAELNAQRMMLDTIRRNSGFPALAANLVEWSRVFVQEALDRLGPELEAAHD